MKDTPHSTLVALHTTLYMVAILAIGMLSGCKTKTVTEYMAVNDTTYRIVRDTVTRTVTKTWADTLRMEVERTVTLNEAGDTIRLVVYRDRWRDRIVHSTDTLHEAFHDTVYIYREQTHDKEVVRQPSWWTQWGWKLAVIIALCAIILIIIGRKDYT